MNTYAIKTRKEYRLGRKYEKIFDTIYGIKYNVIRRNKNVKMG